MKTVPAVSHPSVEAEAQSAGRSDVTKPDPQVSKEMTPKTWRPRGKIAQTTRVLLYIQ